MKPLLAQLKIWMTTLGQGLHRLGWRKPALALAAMLALFLLYVLILIPFTPTISDIRKAKKEQPALVMSADGKLLAEFKRGNRDWVKLSEVSPHVVEALIATEDHRFYRHHGLDWRRTASSIFLTLSGDPQGGSTLTQQLARNLFPEEIGRARSLNRKLKEAITALKIEAVYSKDEILETYLNTVPFLYNAYGIEMAARTYFDKPASKLNVQESATLVGMLKGTSYYNPVLKPERAVERRNTVLAQMLKRNKLSPQQFEALKKKPIRLDFERQSEPPGPASHFAQQLRKWLIDWADRNDYNLYADGLVVRTTLDSRLQAMANEAVSRQGRQLQAIADEAWRLNGGWKANEALVRAFIRETPEYRAACESGLSPTEAIEKLAADPAFMRALHEEKTRIQAAFMALDPHTGQIKAWVGSRGYEQDSFDHVQDARRQPGSTFKPFVYGAAFEQGAKLTDTFVDQAIEIPLAGGEVWRPTDGKEPSGRTMTLRSGLVYSKNTITAQLMQKVGPDKVIKLARAMGVRESKLAAVPSLALGTSPVSLKEMVAAYGTIANSGYYRAPMFVTRIENRKGEVLEEFKSPSPEAALSADATEALLDAMRGVVDQGTGAAIRSRFGIRGDFAGKTGTTQDNTDGWFILMHTQLVAGAWVGFNDGRLNLRSDYWGQGARSALPIVGEFFQQAQRARAFDAKARLVVERDASLIDKLSGFVGSLFGTDEAPKPAQSLPLPTPEASTPIAPPAEASPPLAPPLASESFPSPAPATPASSAPASPAPTPSASAPPAPPQPASSTSAP